MEHDRSARLLVYAALSLLPLAACEHGGAGAATPDGDILVGAHYYLWFPARFEGGSYLRASLLPHQQPLLGEYSSASQSVAEQHIRWASESGIDFFTLDFWPSAPERNAYIDRAFLASRNVAEIGFCIFYELGDLGYDQASGLTVFDARAVERFLSDMDLIASRYFTRPSYLRIAERPVIILYASRTAVGRFEEAMTRFRSRMSERGISPLVIGDEIFWDVATEDGAGHSVEPQRGRIALFDALTAYNLYDPSKAEHSGYGAESGFLTDSVALYERYRQAVPDTPVIPLAMPGYNDRGFRLEADHYGVPRQWTRSAGEGSFFAEWLDRFALPQLDPRLPMLLVTSWNEWSEDTAIEPTVVAPATSSDRSRSGTAYTRGFAYEGYGDRYLAVLREKTGR